MLKLNNLAPEIALAFPRALGPQGATLQLSSRPQVSYLYSYRPFAHGCAKSFFSAVDREPREWHHSIGEGCAVSGGRLSTMRDRTRYIPPRFLWIAAITLVGLAIFA